MWKTIKFHAYPQTTNEQVDYKNQFVFSVIAKENDKDELSEVLNQILEYAEKDRIASQFEIEVHFRLREIYEQMEKKYVDKKIVNAENSFIFETLRSDCDWILSKIKSLKIKPKRTRRRLT
jgi:flagellar motor component MotA